MYTLNHFCHTMAHHNARSIILHNKMTLFDRQEISRKNIFYVKEQKEHRPINSVCTITSYSKLNDSDKIRYIVELILFKKQNYIVDGYICEKDDDVNEIDSEMLDKLKCSTSNTKIDYLFDDNDFCIHAIRKNPSNYSFIKNKTIEHAKYAVSLDPRMFLSIEKHHITPEICKITVEKDPGMIYYIPEEYRSLELCEFAVKKNPNLISCIPEKYRSLELCEIAVKENPDMISHVPEKYRTLEVAKTTVKEELTDSIHISDSNKKIYDLCWIALQHRCYNIYYIKNPTEEMCWIALTEEPTNLEKLENPTEEMCIFALEKNINNIYKIKNLSDDMIVAWYEAHSNHKYEYEDRINDVLKRLRITELYTTFTISEESIIKLLSYVDIQNSRLQHMTKKNETIITDENGNSKNNTKSKCIIM